MNPKARRFSQLRRQETKLGTASFFHPSAELSWPWAVLGL